MPAVVIGRRSERNQGRTGVSAIDAWGCEAIRTELWGMPPIAGTGPSPQPETHLTLAMMASKAGPTNEDYEKAARLGLPSLNENQDPDSIMEQLAAMHPRNNTFPAEVLLELAAEAISESGASQDEPTQYEGLRDR